MSNEISNVIRKNGDYPLTLPTINSAEVATNDSIFKVDENGNIVDLTMGPMTIINSGFDNLMNEVDGQIKSSLKDPDSNIQYLKVLSQGDYNSSYPDNDTLYFINNINEPTNHIGYVLDMIADSKSLWVLTYKRDTENLVGRDQVLLWKAENINNSITTREFKLIKTWNNFKNGRLTLDGVWEFDEGTGKTPTLNTENEPFVVLINSDDELYAFPSLRFETENDNPDIVDANDGKISPFKIAGNVLKNPKEEIIYVSIEKGYCSKYFRSKDQGIIVAYILRIDGNNDTTSIRYLQYGYTSDEQLTKSWSVETTVVSVPNIFSIEVRRLSDYRIGLTYNRIEKDENNDNVYTSYFKYSDRIYSGTAIKPETFTIPYIGNTKDAKPLKIGIDNIIYGAVRNDNINEVPAVQMNVKGPWAITNDEMSHKEVDLDYSVKEYYDNLHESFWYKGIYPLPLNAEGHFDYERIEEQLYQNYQEWVNNGYPEGEGPGFDIPNGSSESVVKAALIEYWHRNIEPNRGIKFTPSWLGEATFAIFLRFYTVPATEDELAQPLTFEILDDDGKLSQKDVWNVIGSDVTDMTSTHLSFGVFSIDIKNEYPYETRTCENDPMWYWAASKAEIIGYGIYDLISKSVEEVNGVKTTVVEKRGKTLAIYILGHGPSSGRDDDELFLYDFEHDQAWTGPTTSFSLTVESKSNNKDIKVRFLADDLCTFPSDNYEMGSYFCLQDVNAKYNFIQNHNIVYLIHHNETKNCFYALGKGKDYEVSGFIENQGLGESLDNILYRAEEDNNTKISSPSSADKKIPLFEFNYSLNSSLAFPNSSSSDFNVGIKYSYGGEVIGDLPKEERKELNMGKIAIRYNMSGSTEFISGGQIDV